MLEKASLAVCVDLSERMRTETVQKRLVDELNHRVKNILATVQALMTISSRHSDSTEQLVKSFSDRIKALSRTHDLLTGTHWQGTTLAEVVNTELQPYADGRSISVEGPEITAFLHNRRSPLDWYFMNSQPMQQSMAGLRSPREQWPSTGAFINGRIRRSYVLNGKSAASTSRRYHSRDAALARS